MFRAPKHAFQAIGRPLKARPAARFASALFSVPGLPPLERPCERHTPAGRNCQPHPLSSSEFRGVIVVSESWNEILERATANLSIKLAPTIPDRTPPAARKNRQAQPRQPRAPTRSHSRATAELEHYLKELDPLKESHPIGGRASVPNRSQKPAGLNRPIFEKYMQAPKAGAPFEQGAGARPAPKQGFRWLRLSNKHLSFGVIALSISAVVIGLAAFLVFGRGAKVASGVSAAKQATPQLEGKMVDIPLPSRRPWRSPLRADGYPRRMD